MYLPSTSFCMCDVTHLFEGSCYEKFCIRLDKKCESLNVILVAQLTIQRVYEDEKWFSMYALCSGKMCTYTEGNCRFCVQSKSYNISKLLDVYIILCTSCTCTLQITMLKS